MIIKHVSRLNEGLLKPYDIGSGFIRYIPADKARELGLKPESVQ